MIKKELNKYGTKFNVTITIQNDFRKKKQKKTRSELLNCNPLAFNPHPVRFASLELFFFTQVAHISVRYVGFAYFST